MMQDIRKNEMYVDRSADIVIHPSRRIARGCAATSELSYEMTTSWVKPPIQVSTGGTVWTSEREVNSVRVYCVTVVLQSFVRANMANISNKLTGNVWELHSERIKSTNAH